MRGPPNLNLTTHNSKAKVIWKSLELDTNASQACDYMKRVLLTLHLSHMYLSIFKQGLHDHDCKYIFQISTQSLEEEIFKSFINNRRQDTGWTERHDWLIRKQISFQQWQYAILKLHWRKRTVDNTTLNSIKLVDLSWLHLLLWDKM